MSTSVSPGASLSCGVSTSITLGSIIVSCCCAKEQGRIGEILDTLGSPLCQSYMWDLKLENLRNLLGHPFIPQVIWNEGE